MNLPTQSWGQNCEGVHNRKWLLAFVVIACIIQLGNLILSAQYQESSSKALFEHPQPIELPPVNSAKPTNTKITSQPSFSAIPQGLPVDPSSTFSGQPQPIDEPINAAKPSNTKITSQPSFSAIPPGLPVDPSSTISSDVSKIVHDQDEGSICVHLKAGARCPHPALIGRLSGPALAILDWKERHNEVGTGTVLCGDYSNKWLDAGDYFVEILVLYCEDFGVGVLERVGNETAWKEKGFASKCVEDALNNRITGKEGSKITIPASIDGKGNYRLGRWVRRAGLPVRPLYTRFQPKECANPKKAFRPLDPLPEWCKPLTNRDQPDGGHHLWNFKEGDEVFGLPEYEFQWRMEISEDELIERLRKRLHDKSMPLPKICAVGDSHSRHMWDRSLPQLNLQGMFEYVLHYSVTREGIASKIANKRCDQVFIQVGQWAPSWYTKGDPVSFANYYSLLKEHVQNVSKVLENNPKGKVYLPTIDQTPLLGRINACNDWRTPTVMDGYSFLNKQIVQALNSSRVEFIDINFIVYPPYDGHPDWIHLLEDVRYRKTIYMTAFILDELEALDAQGSKNPDTQ